MLEVANLDVHYGAVQALRGVSIKVEAGEVVCIIGANGAGKSTTLRAISGLVQPSAGIISLDSAPIAGLPAHQIVRKGIVHAPEGRRIFANLTVAENIQLGAWTRSSDRAGMAEDTDTVYSLFPRLKERAGQLAGTLSGGEQQMLAIGRALMGRPRLLMLDEPSLGLAPFLVQSIFRIIRDINARGVTILLVEQNANQALSVSNRGYVLETGQIVLADSAANLLQNDGVRRAYLGEG